ncbi:MAG: SusC/RagA family TonB-linked outer membrane protein [Ginsengibacter sp.]
MNTKSMFPKTLSITLLILALFQLTAFSQSKVITVIGKVVDNKGQVLPGVSILINGTNSGTTTDANGKYKISAPANAQLDFSFTGFSSQSVHVNGQQEINVSLKPDLLGQELNQVVVVGYGTQKKKDLTGSLASVSADDYKDQPVVSVASALQGHASGVNVSTASGAPGGAVKIRIRGANSINSSNEPLYVVDGVALGSTGLHDIDVNDIASMQILKDASATAIYGSRGANGVVLITTKSGHSGKTSVDYNAFVSINQLPKKYDLLDAVGYAKLVNHIDGANTYSNPDSLAGKGTDWQDMLYRNGITQNHQLSVSGGNEKTKIYISGNYVDQTGIIVNTSEKKYALRSNISTSIGNKIKVGLNISGTHIQSHNNGDLGGIGNPVIATLVWPPTAPVYSDPATGKYNRSVTAPIYFNPYMMAMERDNDGFSNSALINGSVKYDITNWLSLNVNMGVDALLYRSAYLNNAWINPTTQSSGQNSSVSSTLQNSNILTFHKTFNGVHHVTATAIYEQTSSKYNGFGANGSGLSSTEYGYYNLGLNSAQGISSDYSNWGLESYVGRVSYDYKGKYLLTATYRADGSSKFQNSKNKWGYFPSAAVGWRLSEEPFIKDLNVFSNLKLRGSYGVTGNQGISPYSTLGLLASQQYSYGTETLYQGYTLGNPPNPNLKWESTYQADFGIDAGILDGKLNFIFDYYNKNTKDLLLQKTIPDYNGGGAQWSNLGEVNNKGFEFSIDASPISTNQFSWNTSLNFSSYHNKVVSLGGEDMINIAPPGSGFINTNLQVVKVGYPLGSFYLIPWDGIYGEGQGSNGFQPGDNKYIDVDGNGSIGYEDRVIEGSAAPKYQWGFNNDFTYKNFSLNVFILASHGSKIFNATYAAAAIPSSDIKYPTLAASADYWSTKNPSSQWADPASKTNRSYIESSQFLQDGSFVRLKNINLAYTIKRKTLGIADVTLYVSGQNLITLTKYKGYDPEADSMGNNDSAAGIDLGAYPNPKAYTIGLKANF